MPRIYVALDLETTGLTDRDAILEIGAVRFRGDDVLDTWSSLVNPGRPVPHKIQRLTGIAPSEVERAPTLTHLLPALARFIGECPLVGHNIQFDQSFLQRAGWRGANPALDTFELACILMPYASRYSLGKLADELGIGFPTQHRALADAQMTHTLFSALLDRAARLDPKIIEEIVRVSDRSDWALKFAFQDLLRDRARQAFAPGTIGAQLAAKGLASEETFGLFLSRDKEERPLKSKTTPTPLDVDAIVQMLAEDGAFAQQFPNYEYRPQQIQMLRAVAEAFNDGATRMVEAGTGTGKSLAYLLPAIHFATQNNARVVISTNTINLQDQLSTKDIPDLRKVLPFEFRFAVMKGRANYLCRRRLDTLRHSEKLSTDQIKVLAKVLAWLPTTATGDVSELTLMGAESAVWAQLASDPDFCTADLCGHRDERQCFFYRAREKAEAAHLVIVNHALLLSDMVAENHVLPEFKHLVVDEAHHLEARATEALSFEASKMSLENLFRDLGMDRGALLARLSAAIRHKRDLPPNVARELARRFDDAAQDADRAYRGVYDFFNVLESFLKTQAEQGGENETAYDTQIRLTRGKRAQPGWSEVENRWDDLGRKFLKTREGLEKIYADWQDLEEYDLANYTELLNETAFSIRRIRETEEALNAIVAEPNARAIYWAEINKNTGDVSLHAAPLHVGQQLQKNLFASKETVILTSATLCVDGSFSHVKNRLGLGDWADELAVGSPFDFESAALVYIPNDVPEPGQPGYQKAVESALVELFKATRGRGLVLFTSHAQLQNTYRAIARNLEEDDVIVLAQGLDGSRRQVLETFKSQERMVLFGTKSFWEGIDVVGEALSCLAIARLPFSVPSDPIFAARSETFDDPFAQYAVPEAVLRFRQGFGRLIRAKTDRGIIVVLDKRVLTKVYGRVFLDSLPPCSKKQGPLKELPQIAAEWIDRDF